MDTEINKERKEKYLCWSLPIKYEIAIEAFESKFGYKPQGGFIFQNKYLLVGPVMEEERNE